MEISSTSDEEDGGNGSENSTNDGDSNERIDPTSPTNGLSSSASAGKMNIPGGRSSASHLKLPLKVGALSFLRVVVLYPKGKE